MLNVRVAAAAVDPEVGVEALVHRHGVVATRLDVDQKQHVRHGLDDPGTNHVIVTFTNSNSGNNNNTCIYLFVHSFIHPFIHSFIHSFIHLYIYLFI